MKRLITLCVIAAATSLYASKQPNIVFVFCDDLGYGDVQVLNPEHGLIKTPHADKLAAQGMIFTDAHSGASVCTPTRYGLLTGRYSWRTHLQKGVVTGGKPNLIAKARPTVASFLKEQGYDTAIIGKWHLDFQYLDPETGQKLPAKLGGEVPIGSKIPDGPTTRGFDYFHGVHHARSMERLIENDTVIMEEDTVKHLPRLTRKSVEYIENRAKSPDRPFFLYVPLGSPHTPVVPSPEWQGKSGLGIYGDFVMQTDNALGEIKAALERTGLAKNTLIIFSSDNGTSPNAARTIAQTKHKWSAHFRGHKADIWEGGHRVPFIASWPGVIEPGTTSNQTICLVDFIATVSDITGKPLPENSAEDSVSFLPAFKSQPIESTRKGIISHSISGHFAYRMGDWKLILARSSGGWSKPRESRARNNPEAQLYNLAKDPSETTNLYHTNPEVAERLLKQLESDVLSGRSTEGPTSANDIPNDKIKLWKSGRD